MILIGDSMVLRRAELVVGAQRMLFLEQLEVLGMRFAGNICMIIFVFFAMWRFYNRNWQSEYMLASFLEHWIRLSLKIQSFLGVTVWDWRADDLAACITAFQLNICTEICRQLEASGARLLIGGRNEEKLASIASLCPSAQTFALETTDSKQVLRIIVVVFSIQSHCDLDYSHSTLC